MVKTNLHKSYIQTKFILTEDMIKNNKDKIIHQSFFFNSPKDVYITDTAIFKNCRFFYVLKVGSHPEGDWAIYYSPTFLDPINLALFGSKIKDSFNITKLVECSKEVLDRYRY